MRIGIDIRCLTEGKRTGVEEYVLNILENIFELDKTNEYVLFLNSFSRPKTDLEQFAKYSNVRVKYLRIPNKILNFMFWYLRWPKLDKLAGGTDVFFMPNINFSAFSKKTKLVATIHDLSFEHYPETFSLKRRLWHAFVNPRRMARMADKIFAVSDSTKNDLLKTYGVSLDKVSVVKNGLSANFREIDRNNIKLLDAKEEYKLPYKFILYLGTIEPRKNIIGLIKAYNQLRSLKNPELDKYKLAIMGATGWKFEKILNEITKSPYRKDIITTGYVCDFDKEYIYNLASLFVYPSFFEGFGFPPLEAMACGVPVIVSNNSSLPEVAGDAGILVDPNLPDEIYQAMKEILLHKNLAEKLKQEGIKQAKKFHWQKSAEEFLRLISQIKAK